jgi:proteasome lid subunit RPN8/RPN11
MSFDIQFGELEHAEPQKGLRPDQDAHFCVMPVGEIGMPETQHAGQGDLMIFVDLDVMRDMEAHANSDTSVELGGVMLGRQLFDDQGQPFVVITDCLRAEHYHATKGSFKFTHDTWSQITERRRRLRPDLEMVGWYHTHPGWTVFLSGMDLFICNNFFNKPLDVALVIDPVNDDRGWFQWTAGARPVTRPTQGFYLITNKYRLSELKYFSRLYSKGPLMHDPRYSETTFGGNSPVVNVTENRRPLIDVAIVAMLTLQFMLLGLLAWKMLSPPMASVNSDPPATKPLLSSVDQARDEAYREILRTAIGEQGADPGLVDRFAELKMEHAKTLANLDGQLVRAEQFAAERDNAKSTLQLKSAELADLGEKIAIARRQNEELVNKLAALEKNSQENGSGGEQTWGIPANYWWWSIVGAAFAIAGVSGYIFGIRKGKTDAYIDMGEFDSKPARPAGKSGGHSGDNRDRINLSISDEPIDD